MGEGCPPYILKIQSPPPQPSFLYAVYASLLRHKVYFYACYNVQEPENSFLQPASRGAAGHGCFPTGVYATEIPWYTEKQVIGAVVHTHYISSWKNKCIAL